MSTTSHAGLFVHLAARPPPRATPPPRRSRRSTRSGSRPTARSSRAGAGRGPSALVIATITAGSVRGKCSRPHDGQCRDQPASPSSGARAARGAERRLEQPAAEAQRLDEGAGVARRQRSADGAQAPPTRRARRTSSPSLRGERRRPAARRRRRPRPRNAHSRAVGRPSAGDDPRAARRAPPSGAASPASTSTRVAASARAVSSRSGVARSSAARSRPEPASGGSCVLSGAVIEDLSASSIGLGVARAGQGVARGRTGAPDLPWAHGTLTLHSSRVRDVGSAPGRRRRSRRADRRRGRSLRRRGGRTRRRPPRRRARSRGRRMPRPSSPPRCARCAR